MVQVVNRIKTEMGINLITTVLFDWDQTLAAILGGIPVSGRLKALFQRENIIYPIADIENALTQYDIDVFQQQIDGSIKPQTKADIIFQYEYILRYLGHTNITAVLLHRLYEGYAFLPTILYEDTLLTLRTLKQEGLQLGIISNHTPAARAMMEKHLSDLIEPEHIFISGEMGLHKPEGRIFRCALDQMEVAPTACIFVGDDLFVDAIGAVEQGDMTLGLWLDRSGQPPHTHLPDNVKRITSLKEVLLHI